VLDRKAVGAFLGSVFDIQGETPNERLVGGLPTDVHAFDGEAAYAAGELRRLTRSAGLSFGDRACLALAIRLGVRAMTADRAWGSLGEGTGRVTVIR
jgi:ribonuclease VapC